MVRDRELLDFRLWPDQRCFAMSASDSASQVLSHGPVERLEANLWRIEGSLPGMSLRRVMTLVRLDDGRVVIHSAIALEEELLAELEQWGCPAILIVPNGFHRLDAPAYKARYPDLMVLCPQPAARRVADVVSVDGDLSRFPQQDTVTCEYLDGTGQGEGYLLVRHGGSASLVLNDAIFNMPHVSGVVGWLLRHATRSTGGPTVSRIARWMLVKHRARFREQLRQFAEVPNLKRIIVSHHQVIDTDPAGTLLRLAATL